MGNQFPRPIIGEMCGGGRFRWGDRGGKGGQSLERRHVNLCRLMKTNKGEKTDAVFAWGVLLKVNFLNIWKKRYD